MGGHAIRGRYVLNSDASLVKRVGRLKLVGWVHVLAYDVLSQARLNSVHTLGFQYAAGNGGSFGDPPLLG